MTPFVACPVTVIVRMEAVELTGVAVRVDDMTATGLTPFGVQATRN
jgi:hypothetical protein